VKRDFHKSLWQQGVPMQERDNHPALVQAKRLSLRSIQGACQFLLAAAIILAGLSGCSRRYDDMPAYLPWLPKESENASVGRFKTSYLAEQIDDFYRGTNPGPLGVTTFVNIDDLYTTSTFGRMLGEQLMSELAMRGFDVIELRHADALRFLNTGGEFALSRDIAAVKRERELGGVVVGTYVVSPVRVYVNARLLDPSNSMVLSAGSVEMSKTGEIARLLKGGSLPSTLERIPVKHLGFATYPMEMFPNYMRSMYDLEESGPPSPVQRPEPQFAQPNSGQK
jgi:TolB-like protein